MLRPALIAFVLYVSLHIGGFAAEAGPKAPLQVEIVPNHSLKGGLRLLTLRGFDQQWIEFDVVLTNISEEPVTVWETNCSWGFHCLSIEMLNNDNRRVITRKPVWWDGNSPRPFTIPPKGHFLFPVKMGDGTWPTDWLSRYARGSQVTLRAIYTSSPIDPDSLAQRYAAEIWVGSVAGRPEVFTFR